MSSDPIRIEQRSRAQCGTFWPLHWDYLVRDMFDETDTEADRAYFCSEEYRGAVECAMARPANRVHQVFFHRGSQHIGCAQYVIYQDEGGKCLIMDFWLFPPYRRQGAGHDCFRALEQAARDEGAAWFAINYHSDGAHRFWRSLGFADDGTDEYGDPLMRKG